MSPEVSPSWLMATVRVSVGNCCSRLYVRMLLMWTAPFFNVLRIRPVWWIRQAIQYHRSEYATTIRIPLSAQTVLRKLVTYSEKQLASTGYAPTLDAAAEATETPRYYLQALPLWENGGHYLSGSRQFAR